MSERDLLVETVLDAAREWLVCYETQYGLNLNSIETRQELAKAIRELDAAGEGRE